ncbi:MAG: type II toxin-antitoxin system RelE/ParE family toxin [Pirellulales bacterium]|nr:type II toxin-antitoxin system RelE/ParE family toxin [Pirellulales bacterium]
MPKILGYHSEAEAELIQAADWYEQQRPGLGDEFLDEIDSALLRICQAPESFGFIYADVRCHLVHRFPFGILYVLEPKDIVVVAVMHLHRDPDYWKHRVEAP